MKMQFLLPSLAINHFQFRILTFNPMNKLSAIMLCLGLLLAIPDNFPKMVISMDEMAGGSYQGIQHLHIEDFLISITETTLK